MIFSMTTERPPQGAFIAFLLAQVGAHAAKAYAERLAPLQLSPPHAGILRRLARRSGMSQRELATELGMHASRLVGVVDELEGMGLVARQGNQDDRRANSLELTPKGRETLSALGRVSCEHNDALGAALSIEEREQLAALLQRIADHQGLTRGVHPGYGRLGEARK